MISDVLICCGASPRLYFLPAGGGAAPAGAAGGAEETGGGDWYHHRGGGTRWEAFEHHHFWGFMWSTETLSFGAPPPAEGGGASVPADCHVLQEFFLNRSPRYSPAVPLNSTNKTRTRVSGDLKDVWNYYGMDKKAWWPFFHFFTFFHNMESLSEWSSQKCTNIPQS